MKRQKVVFPFIPFPSILSHFVELVDWACLFWAEPLAAGQPITNPKSTITNSTQFTRRELPQEMKPFN
jgi:hypothetical protein